MQVEATKSYIYGLAATAAAAFSGWLYLVGISFSWESVGIATVLMLACVLSRRFPLDFGRAEVDVADVAVLVALVILGPVWALIVAAPNFLYKERLRTIFVSACDTLVIVSAGYIFTRFSAPLIADPQLDSSLVYGAAAAGVAFYTLDALINSNLAYLKYGSSVAKTLRESFLPLIPSDIAAVLAALGTAYVMVMFGPAAALVLLLGATAALISLHLIHKHQRENEVLKEENAGLLASSVQFAAGIVESIGEKDGYTARLAAASSVFAGDVAGEFGLNEERVKKLKVAALLQDVGLVGVPDEVFMSSPEKLNSVGRMQLERHTLGSERILSGAASFEEAAKWVRWHHERIDGTGYPDRLKGPWIPHEARILAVCEAYASMVLDGPQSPALSAQEARMELTSLSERSLDAEVVKALLRVLDREDANYATAADSRFAFTTAAKVDEGNSFSLRIV